MLNERIERNKTVVCNFFHGRLIASASFDKSVRLWRASDGAFISTFRGHVQAVYSVSWSVDSRLLVTGSKDSTLKGILLIQPIQ